VSEETGQIRSNYLTVRDQIDARVKLVHREPGSVKLVVVTKGQPVEKMQALIDSGARWIGENYPEETAEKLSALHDIQNIEWHMIGHIQSRKIKYLVQHFDVVESVESLETAQKLNSRFEDAKRKIKILLEVNVSGEATKQGFDLVNRKDWGRFVDYVGEIETLPALDLVGLMTIPPLGDDAETSRAYFRLLREVLEYVNLHKHGRALSELSMGTSFDYLVAVEEGATIVRVGEAIMGARHYS